MSDAQVEKENTVSKKNSENARKKSTLTSKALANIKKIVAALVLSILIVIVLTLLTLPSIVTSVSRDQLAKLGIAFDIGNLDINLFTGEIVASDVLLHGSDQEPSKSDILKIDQFQLLFSPRAIFKRHLYIKTIELNGARIPVSKAGEHWLIAGINPSTISNDTSEQEPEHEPQAEQHPASENLSISLDNLFVNSLQVKLRNSLTDNSAAVSAIKLAHLSLANFNNQRASTIPYQIELLLDQVSSINLQGQALVDLNQDKPLWQANTEIKPSKISSIEVEQLLTLLEQPTPAQLSDANAIIELTANVEAKNNGQQLEVSNIETTVDSLKVLQGETNVTLKGVHTSVEKLSSLSASNGEDNPVFAIANIAFSAQSIDIIDQRTLLNFENIQASVDKIDNASQVLSNIDFKTDLGEFGTISASSTLNIFKPLKNVHAKLKANDIDLSAFTGFSEQSIGRSLERGSLSLNTQLGTKNDIVDGEIKAKIVQLKFGAASEKNAETTALPELGIPLNTALIMLKDGNDVIDLKIPVSGEDGELNIGLQSIIQKAILKSIKFAIASQFNPMIALSAVDKANNLRSLMAMEPVYFQEGSAALASTDAFANNNSSTTNVNMTKQQSIDADANNQSLDNIADFLQRKAKINLNLCSTASVTEKATLDENKLKLLAKDRSNAVKRALVDRGVESNRLITCDKPAKEKTTGMVSFSF